MSNNIVRIAVKKKRVNFNHYNLLDYKESIGENFELQIHIDNFKILWLFFLIKWVKMISNILPSNYVKINIFSTKYTKEI